VRVDGFDLDSSSIEDAWANAHRYGLTDRVTFHVRAGGDPTLNGRYDLVTAFGSIHDLDDPTGALSTMRRLAGEQGAVLVMEHWAVTGSLTPAATLPRYALQAGFRSIETLPIVHHFFCFYRLHR
jgi:hypothetical protein